MNCKMQMAETTPVNPEKSGIPAAIAKAIAQYTGIMPTQRNLPVLVVRAGALKTSTNMLLYRTDHKLEPPRN